MASPSKSISIAFFILICLGLTSARRFLGNGSSKVHPIPKDMPYVTKIASGSTSSSSSNEISGGSGGTGFIDGDGYARDHCGYGSGGGVDGGTSYPPYGARGCRSSRCNGPLRGGTSCNHNCPTGAVIGWRCGNAKMQTTQDSEPDDPFGDVVHKAWPPAQASNPVYVNSASSSTLSKTGGSDDTPISCKDLECANNNEAKFEKKDDAHKSSEIDKKVQNNGHEVKLSGSNKKVRIDDPKA